LDNISRLQSRLEELGLNEVEAAAYLALVQGGTSGAARIAHTTGRQRSSIYHALGALSDRGMVEGGAGYGSRFRAVPPDKALEILIRVERDRLERRAEIVEQITPLMEQLGRDAEDSDEKVIEVLRSSQAVSERFDRLQLEAEREIEVFVKAPVIATRRGNPAEMRALKRGVRDRGLYDQAVLDVDVIRTWMPTWDSAGEEIRIYPGELPMKMALVDRRNVLLPLPTPGHGNGVTSVVIRHTALGEALHLLFDHLWELSRPFTDGSGDSRVRSTPPPTKTRRARKSRPETKG
jgi:HTH-type transcriptional regulator, sugar sensing transcriptional regulator